MSIYYIRTIGSDLNDGLSAANAFATFGAFRNIAVAGDICYVGSGTYNQSIPDASANGTKDLPIKLIFDTLGAHTDDIPGNIIIVPSSSETISNTASYWVMENNGYSTYSVILSDNTSNGGYILNDLGSKNIFHGFRIQNNGNVSSFGGINTEYSRLINIEFVSNIGQLNISTSSKFIFDSCIFYDGIDINIIGNYAFYNCIMDDVLSTFSIGDLASFDCHFINSDLQMSVMEDFTISYCTDCNINIELAQGKQIIASEIWKNSVININVIASNNTANVITTTSPVSYGKSIIMDSQINIVFEYDGAHKLDKEQNIIVGISNNDTILLLRSKILVDFTNIEQNINSKKINITKYCNISYSILKIVSLAYVKNTRMASDCQNINHATIYGLFDRGIVGSNNIKTKVVGSIIVAGDTNGTSCLDNVISYNCLIYNSISNKSTNYNLITADPLFVDHINFDLSPTSPAINHVITPYIKSHNGSFDVDGNNISNGINIDANGIIDYKNGKIYDTYTLPLNSSEFHICCGAKQYQRAILNTSIGYTDTSSLEVLALSGEYTGFLWEVNVIQNINYTFSIVYRVDGIDDGNSVVFYIEDRDITSIITNEYESLQNGWRRTNIQFSSSQNKTANICCVINDTNIKIDSVLLDEEI